MTIIILLGILIALSVATIVLLLNKKTSKNDEEILSKLLKMADEINRIDLLVRDEFSRNRNESQNAFQGNREELSKSFKILGDTLSNTVTDLSNSQNNQFNTFSTQLANLIKITDEKLKDIRETVEVKLNSIQNDNNLKLEEMRKTVDEKLEETVERRFTTSFKVISERLEEVHKGLGEMQNLASGVGDLKKILSNVKTRGNLGEIQLGAILEQMLSPEQYIQNAIIKEHTQERVEFAVKLPDKNYDKKYILLPIDSKFPTEDYQRLLDAYDNIANLNPKDKELIYKQFENSIKKNAKDIKEKYINPPTTTDFAIMFVPTEGLYAEILKRPGLFETLQRDLKITIVGPTNLVAYLSALQMGFRTLAIEKRSSEIWDILRAVKTEFGYFGNILEKTKKKLQEASNVIDDAGTKSRSIERRLKNFEALPQEQSAKLLGEPLLIEPKNDNDDIK